MRKTEKRKQQSGAPAAGRRGRSKVLAVIALAAAVVASIAIGRQATTTMAQNDGKLIDKFDRAVKSKEPSWKLVKKNERKGAEQKYFTQDWGLGEDEYVETTTYEFADAGEAARELADFIKQPASVPVRRTLVPGLGDEAYAFDNEGTYGRKGAGTVVVRSGNVMIRLDSSSVQAAKRFARHMVNALDAK